MDSLRSIYCRHCKAEITAGEGRWWFFDRIYQAGIVFCTGCVGLADELRRRDELGQAGLRDDDVADFIAETGLGARSTPERSEP